MSSSVYKAGLRSLSLGLKVCRMPESRWSSTHIGRWPRSWDLMAAAAAQGRLTDQQGEKAGKAAALLPLGPLSGLPRESAAYSRGGAYPGIHPGNTLLDSLSVCVLVDSRSSLADNQP